MPVRYRLYGLTLECDFALACPRVPPDIAPDVRLKRAAAARFEAIRAQAGIPPRSARWFECVRLEDGATDLRWAKLFEFLIAPDARTIECRPLEQATHHSLTTYLLGQVLSFSLLSSGYDPLHATAVVIDGAAVAFLGDCGDGKSTLGAALVARGFPLLTDDVLALKFDGERFLACAGPARIKLFPTVARSLLGRSGTQRLNPGTRKLVLPLSNRHASSDAVPLAALYVLGQARSRRLARVTLTPLTGQRAFLQVIRAAFNLIAVDRSRLEKQFGMAADLAKAVPVTRLSYPRTLSRLDDVCEAILARQRRATDRRSA
jgi:hypothetical protein